MDIKTFVLVFDAAMLCYYSNGTNCAPMETCIQKTIDNYCSENNVVECERAITTAICQGNARFFITVTSKFESKV